MTVTANASASANFEVTQAASQLDAVIVTGTGGGAEKRTLGNAVTTLDVADVTSRNSILNVTERFVPVSQLNFGNPVNSPADIVYETMNLDLRIMEVDPIHRRIVLAVTNIPEEQPPRPETPSTVIPMETDDYTAVGPAPTDIPYDEAVSE